MENSKSDPVTVDIRNMLDIFRNRKWWFAGVFILVLLLGLVYTFLIAAKSQYGSEIKVALSTENLGYQELVSENYPDLAGKLWLIEDGKYVGFHSRKYFDAITRDLESYQVLEETIKRSGINLRVNELKGLIKTNRDQDYSYLNIVTYYSNPVDAEKINQALVGAYLDAKRADFESAYNELSTTLSEELDLLEQELEELSREAESYYQEYSRELIEELSEGTDIEVETLEFLPPELENRIDTVAENYNGLKDLKDNLEDYRHLYTERIGIIDGPEVFENFNYFRNILLSIVAAVFFGLVWVYIVDFIYTVKKRK